MTINIPPIFYLLISVYLIGHFEDVEVLKRLGAYGSFGAAVPLNIYEFVKFWRMYKRL